MDVNLKPLTPLFLLGLMAIGLTDPGVLRALGQSVPFAIAYVSTAVFLIWWAVVNLLVRP